MRCFKINIENWYFSCYVQKLLLEWGGVIKQFMDNSCIYKINIPSLYSQYIGIKYFIPDLPLNILWLLMNLMMESWFSKWAWNLRQWKRSRCTLYLYKAFYFYEKLDNPVLCKDATHSFMIISDQYMPILCMMTLISLSLLFITWIGTLLVPSTECNKNQQWTIFNQIAIYCMIQQYLIYMYWYFAFYILWGFLNVPCYSSTIKRNKRSLLIISIYL